MMIRRKVIWLIIFMVWVGMVSSIIIYQGHDYLALDSPAAGDIKVEEEPVIKIEQQSSGEVNYTQVKEDTETQKDFFIEYRLERDKARSEQIDIFREMINNPNTDEATKKEAQKKMLALTDKMEKEMEIESMIRARGFKDALAYIHEDSVDVIIQTNGLEKNDVARVGDIIVKTTGFSFEDVTIIEKRAEEQG